MQTKPLMRRDFGLSHQSVCVVAGLAIEAMGESHCLKSTASYILAVGL